jgi:hypothetical protein
MRPKIRCDGESTVLLQNFLDGPKPTTMVDGHHHSPIMGRYRQSPVHKLQPAAGPKPRRSWPPQGFLKINTDGAYVQATKKGAWGFTIRDYTGDHVLAGTGNAGQLQDALTAEASSCLKRLWRLQKCMASPTSYWRWTRVF